MKTFTLTSTRSTLSQVFTDEVMHQSGVDFGAFRADADPLVRVIMGTSPGYVPTFAYSQIHRGLRLRDTIWENTYDRDMDWIRYGSVAGLISSLSSRKAIAKRDMNEVHHVSLEGHLMLGSVMYRAKTDEATRSFHEDRISLNLKGLNFSKEPANHRYSTLTSAQAPNDLWGGVSPKSAGVLEAFIQKAIKLRESEEWSPGEYLTLLSDRSSEYYANIYNVKAFSISDSAGAPSEYGVVGLDGFSVSYTVELYRRINGKHRHRFVYDATLTSEVSSDPNTGIGRINAVWSANIIEVISDVAPQFSYSPKVGWVTTQRLMTSYSLHGLYDEALYDNLLPATEAESERLITDRILAVHDSLLVPFLNKARASCFASTMDAYESYKTFVDSDFIESLSELNEVATLVNVNSYVDLLEPVADVIGGAAKASTAFRLIDMAADLTLLYSFGIKPLVSDLEEVATKYDKIVKDLTRRLGVFNGKATRLMAIGSMDATLVTRSRITLTQGHWEAQGAMMPLNRVGLSPTLSSAYNLIPFSFALDWTPFGLGNKLDQADSSIYLMKHTPLSYLHSYSLFINFDDLEHLSGDGQLTVYRRENSIYFPPISYDWAPATSVPPETGAAMFWKLLSS